MLQVPALLSFIQRLELLAFFGGYPLLFALLYSGRVAAVRRFLPAGYALTATIFVIRQVFDLDDPATVFIIALKTWGCLAILFWLPYLRKRVFLAFFHSLPFFGLLVYDLVTGVSTAAGRDQISNDMAMLTGSLLLNGISLSIAVGGGFLRRRWFNG